MAAFVVESLPDDVQIDRLILLAPALAPDYPIGERILLSNALEHGDASWKSRFSAWPVGFLERIRPVEEEVDIDRWLAVTDRWAAGTRISVGSSSQSLLTSVGTLISTWPRRRR